MFKVKVIVAPSGKGRAAKWGEIKRTVTKVLKQTVIVQWQDCAVEDEMKFDEVVPTGRFAAAIPRICRALRATDDAATAGELLTVTDEWWLKVTRRCLNPSLAPLFIVYKRRHYFIRLSALAFD